MSGLPPSSGPLAWTTRRARPHSLRLLGAFSVLYFGATCLLAARTPLWFDELFTVHLSRLPAGRDLWAALADGTDLNPPLSYLLTRLAVVGLGENALAVRFPAVIGFWVLGVCLFRFVGRRCGPAHALLAALVPLATGAYPGAYEARPYGLMLGFCGLSLVCWQAAVEGRRRALALPGLAAALAAGLSSHYYSAMLIFPLAAGELVRSLARRRLDVPLWLALGAGLAPLPAFLPLLGAARSFTYAHVSRPGWDAVGSSYAFLFRRTGLLLLVGFTLAAIVFPKPARQGGAGDAVPIHEVAAAVGLLALPLLGALVGRFAVNAFTPRYAVAAVAGLSITLAFLGRRSAVGGGATAAGVCLVLAGCFAADVVGESGRLAAGRRLLAQTCRALEGEAEGERLIVVADPFMFLQASYYAPPQLAGRMVFLTPPSVAGRDGPRDLSDAALFRLQRWAPIRVAEYRSFLLERSHFLLLGDRSWLRPALEADGLRLEQRRCDAGQPLFAADARPD